MNKKFAVEILTEVQGTSPSYIKEYGVSLVKEAYNYLRKLKIDEQTGYLLDKVSDLLLRI